MLIGQDVVEFLTMAEGHLGLLIFKLLKLRFE